MTKSFKISCNPSLALGGLNFQVQDSEGDTPNAATLQQLSDELNWLAKLAKDKEDSARLELGKYYWHRRKGGVTYLQVVGVDEKGVKCVYVDKDGRPTDTGKGTGAIEYFGSYPISGLVLQKNQPLVG